MDYPRPCGCKGCRVCLLCEKEFGIQTKDYGSIFRVSFLKPRNNLPKA